MENVWWDEKAPDKVAVYRKDVGHYPNCENWSILINCGLHMVRDASGTAAYTLEGAKRLHAELTAAIAAAEKDVMPVGDGLSADSA